MCAPGAGNDERGRYDQHTEFRHASSHFPRRGLTRGLFLLIQAMYLIFYLEALLHWQGVHRIAGSFLPGWGAVAILVAVVVTAAQD